jgi:tRNA modification GTPase
MTTAASDTIAAIATAPGRGGVGIVRVSGPRAPAIAAALLGDCPPPRHARYTAFRDAGGEALDSGLALFFPAPHSFTGEDVLELQGHGGPVVLGLVLDAALAEGARLARPGEFTERAFLNGKLDLAQAEAVADLIEAHSAQAARAAQRSLDGEFSRRVQALFEALAGLRLHIEAGFDFSDEDIEFIGPEERRARLAEIMEQLAALRATARQGALLRDGLCIVLAGAPNAGKSSLLNALARRDAAIVSATPGTTRDVLREHLHLGGLPVQVLDTAGLRDSGDAIEREGVRRAHEALARADLVLWVQDGREPPPPSPHLPAGVPLLVVRNKCDLSGHPPGLADGAVHLSALSGAGLEALESAVLAAVGYAAGAGGELSARRRHVEALAACAEAVAAAQAADAARQPGELVAEELRLAQEALAAITGAFGADDLLGLIFSRFCIGK